MNRFEFIRGAVGVACGAATGYAVASACAWICTVASLGAFLSFVIWLFGVLVLYGAVHTTSQVISQRLDDTALNKASTKASAWIKGLRSKVSA